MTNHYDLCAQNRKFKCTSEYYSLLQLEYHKGIRARDNQVKLYEHVTGNEPQAIIEQRPGSGKTTMLPALASALIAREKHIIIEIPPELYSVQSQELSHELLKFGHKPYHLKKIDSLSSDSLTDLNKELIECKETNRLF